MVKKIVQIPLLSNEIVEVKLGNTIGILESFSKRISFNSGTRIDKATLTLTGLQTYLSGAELTAMVNEVKLNPPVRWHALENNEKTVKYDISATIANGVNTFSALYRTAYGVINDNKCNVTMAIELVMNVSTNSSPGVTYGNTTSTDIGRNIWQRVRESANYIIAIGVIAVILIGVTAIGLNRLNGLRKFS